MEKENGYLVKRYKEWRTVSESMLADGMDGSTDCGEEAVRKDFSTYAELEQVISFEDMLELEQYYDGFDFQASR